MKDEIRESLRRELLEDPEARAHYAEMLLDTTIALQLKTLRQQRDWTQKQLAEMADMRQSRISTMEKIDYSSWSIRILKQLAKAFDVRLRVTFESFGTLLDDYTRLGRADLERPSFSDDPAFHPEKGKPKSKSSRAASTANELTGKGSVLVDSTGGPRIVQPSEEMANVLPFPAEGTTNERRVRTAGITGASGVIREVASVNRGTMIGGRSHAATS